MTLETSGTIESLETVNAEELESPTSLEGFTYSTSSTSKEQLPSHAVATQGTVAVIYDGGNTGAVYVGSSSVQPAKLNSTSDQFVANVADTSQVYVRTPNSGDSVGVLYEA